VKDHIWKLAEMNLVKRGKKHFDAKNDTPQVFKFGKHVFTHHNETSDWNKLELTKSGKTKI